MAPAGERARSLLSLDGKRVLVAGASSGIGARLAAALHEAGAAVAICARRTERLAALAAELRGRPGAAPVFPVAMDVAALPSIRSAFDEAEQQLGGVCDVVLNAAGISRPNAFAKVTEADYDAVMATNLKGAFFLSQEAARRMVGAGIEGSIINVASILAVRQAKTSSVYCMTKAAMVQMTKVLALELGPRKIRVNALCPGYYKTEINEDLWTTPHGARLVQSTPLGRLGELHELEGAALLLASGAGGSYITGSAITVDGGLVNAGL
eukprot:TRINITY_DN50381_c0_g1_i1.p2 TRINITY_DN50381_c0_g1~~TRINITY_DN50381_c0_g1_i1.p2  ORF type:complete len:291 (+),score=114.99 TRINITY_DN50381_c0_g1_i1:75-875(+)